MEIDNNDLKKLVDLHSQHRITTFWANTNDVGIPKELVLDLKMLSNTNKDVPIILYYDEKNSPEDEIQKHISEMCEEHRFKDNINIVSVSDLFKVKEKLITDNAITRTERNEELDALEEVKEYYKYCVNAVIGAAIGSNPIKYLSLSFGKAVALDSGMMPTSIPVDFKALDDKCDQKKRRFLIGSMNEGRSLGYCFYGSESQKVRTIAKYFNKEEIKKMENKLKKLNNPELEESSKETLKFNVRNEQDFNFVLLAKHYMLSDLTVAFEAKYGDKINPTDLDDFMHLENRMDSGKRTYEVDFIKEEPEELYQPIYNKVTNKDRQEILDYQNEEILHKFFDIKNLTHRQSWRDKSNFEREEIKNINKLTMLNSVVDRYEGGNKKTAFEKLKNLHATEHKIEK